MAGNNTQNQTMSLGEISTIRNILMGQQMNEYEANFQNLTGELAATKTDFDEKLKASDGKTEERFVQLEKEMIERFDRLETLLLDNISQLNKKIEEISRGDKQELGKMLSTLSQKLLES